MAITLGKDCTVAVGGTIASARSVTFEIGAKTLDVDAYASRLAAVYSTGWDSSVSIEFNDAADFGTMFDALKNGDLVAISGGAAAWSFNAVLTRITESDPIDGVATFTAEAKLTVPGLRASG